MESVEIAARQGKVCTIPASISPAQLHLLFSAIEAKPEPHPTSAPSAFWEAHADDTFNLDLASCSTPQLEIPLFANIASTHFPPLQPPHNPPSAPSPPSAPLCHAHSSHHPTRGLPLGVEAAAATGAQRPAQPSPAYVPPAGLREDLVAVRLSRGGRCGAALARPAP